MIKYPLNIKPPLSFPTVSGDICSFVSPYAGLALKSHVVTIPPKLTGVSEINIVAPSTNLWGGGYMLYTFRKMNLAYLAYDNSTLTFSAVSMSGYKQILTGVFKANTQYTLILVGNKDTSNNHANISVLYTDNTRVNLFFDSTPQTKQTLVYTSTAGKTIQAITGANGANNTTLYYNECCLLEGVKTADDFVPFNFFANVQIGSIVFGGIYDAITGLFTATHARLDMGTFTWYYNSSFNRFTTNAIQSTSKYPASSELPNMVCDLFDVVTFDDFRDYTSVNHVLALGTTGNISARATEYGTDENAFTTAMSGKYITYELANPTTIQLVSVRVETLLGQNNVWSDVGPTELQYPKIG